MKKVFTLSILLFALIFSQSAFSQKVVKESEEETDKPAKKTRPMEEYEYGAKLGVNYAKVNTEYVTNPKARWGVAVGVFGIYNWTKDFAFQAELLYTQKGFNKSSSELEEILHFDYIELPVLFKYKFKIGRGLYASGYAGPSFGLLASATYTKEYSYDTGIDIPAENLDEINGFNFGLSLGFDLRTRISDIGEFLIDVRYNGINFTNIVGTLDKEPYRIFNEGKHNVISLSVGYFF